MQSATCTNLRIRSPSDARVLFHAVATNRLPMVTRRLDTQERQVITSGCCYVWEERGHQAELTGVGIERWTDGWKWGPSRVNNGFLFYQEKRDKGGLGQMTKQDKSLLNKQTYTVYVETPQGRRKWHLIAYFTQESLARLKVIDDFPDLVALQVPPGSYPSARHPKGRPEYIFRDTGESADFVAYMPHGSPVSPVPSPASSSSYHKMPTFIMWPTGRHQANNTASPYTKHSSEPNTAEEQFLAPLEYIQRTPVSRRHPIDETTLMRFQHHSL